MPARRVLALASFTGAALGGAALGWLGERRAVGQQSLGRLAEDPEWRELQRRLPSTPHRVVSADGTVLHAQVSGPRGAPTLVLAHGYGFSSRAWHYQRRDLAEEYRLVVYDQRGHGRSDQAAGGDWSVGALGRDLHAVLEALVPPGERAVVVGHSMGGMSLLSWAAQHPALVDRRLAGAVLCDTTGGDVLAGGAVSIGIAALSVLEQRVWTGGFRLLGRGATVADRAYAASNDLSFLLIRAIGLSRSASPAHVAFVEQMMLDCPNTVKAALGPTLTGLNLVRAAPLLTVPALVIVGAQDRLTPPAAARRLARGLPRAEVVEIPGAGHNPAIEAHEAVTGHLRRFARRTLARAA